MSISLKRNNKIFLLEICIISFSCAVFQSLALKLLACGPLIHARLAISLITGLSVFWLGVGAALSSLLITRKKIISLFTGIMMLITGVLIPLLLKYALLRREYLLFIFIFILLPWNQDLL
ncbi:MAG TPA: hypothetical protein PL110_11690 [Candidatus Eremiobacteraeota bacterium]|nr:MAG: hypothetical protein BWY64_01668 [bacterium ADurb.Bin363]HPZ08770.1 hypothetical protein [Candidatus Eremiobacteraeota bacterium]